jgi:TolB-like protein
MGITLGNNGEIMKIKLIFMPLLIFVITFSMLYAQNKMAILPMHSLGVDSISTQTAEYLLNHEIGKLTSMDIIPQKLTSEIAGDEYCMDVDCASEIGEKLNVEQVVSCGLSKLGDKVIVQFMLVDVAARKILITDNMTSTSIEDLEMVMKRVALSIINQKPIDKTAEVGAIVKSENKSFRRRKAIKFTGLSFGYLYPQEGYDEKDRSFSFDLRKGYEITNLAIGGQFAIRHGIATNIYISYLLTKTDLCPYIGGAFGFHWVAHDNDEKKRTDGFEVIGSIGIRAFRTYNFQVIMNIDYTYVFNDYDDQAIVFTIGLLH